MDILTTSFVIVGWAAGMAFMGGFLIIICLAFVRAFIEIIDEVREGE